MKRFSQGTNPSQESFVTGCDFTACGKTRNFEGYGLYRPFWELVLGMEESSCRDFHISMYPMTFGVLRAVIHGAYT